jgi:hypothetical protein
MMAIHMQYAPSARHASLSRKSRLTPIALKFSAGKDTSSKKVLTCEQHALYQGCQWRLKGG